MSTSPHQFDSGPISVNYFMSRSCNYSCKFCFHTQTNSYHLPLKDAERGLQLLAGAGMRKLNFTGGEPFLLDSSMLGPLVRFAKDYLALDCVSIVSNGSRISREWFSEYGQFLDVLAISCDSFDRATCRELGRGSGVVIDRLPLYRAWCDEFGVLFKVNTVVSSANRLEDMNGPIRSLDPFRWKCFQLLILEGENSGTEGDLRDARSLAISDAEFHQFVSRHSGLPCLVPEDARTMRDSYLLLDEQLRFLDCRDGSKRPGSSILEVGVEQALADSGFNVEAFVARGGLYWMEELEQSKADSAPTPHRVL